MPYRIRRVEGTRPGETILVVEDDRDMRDLTVALLRRQGYRVIAAGAADEALTLAANHPEIRLLLTDIWLPAPMNGHALAARLREQRPALKVIYMSGGADTADCPMTLRKPFKPAELTARVRETLTDDRCGKVDPHGQDSASPG